MPPRKRDGADNRPVSGLASLGASPSRKYRPHCLKQCHGTPPVAGGLWQTAVTHPHSLTVAGAAGELQRLLLRTPFPFHPLTPEDVARHLLLKLKYKFGITDGACSARLKCNTVSFYHNTKRTMRYILINGEHKRPPLHLSHTPPERGKAERQLRPPNHYHPSAELHGAFR